MSDDANDTGSPPDGAGADASAADASEGGAPRTPAERKKKRRARGDDAAPSSKEPAALIAAPLTPRAPRAIAVAVVATLALVALDLGTKAWAEERLSTARLGEPPAVCAPGASGYSPHQRIETDPIVFVDGILELSYTENCGAAFSLFDGLPGPLRHAIFYIAAILATLVLSRMFYQGKGGRFFEVAVPMVVAGALGNFHDRVRFGYVVDFIHTYWEGHFDYPIFNVADILVVSGVIALVVDSFREGRGDVAAPPAKASEKQA